MGRYYSAEVKCEDQKKLELITLRIAYFTMEDIEEIQEALEAGEISLNGDSRTSISIKNGESKITFNDVSYMDLPNVFEDPDDSEMYDIFKSCALIAGASGAFEAGFNFCDDWAGYEHWGECIFNSKKINYSDSVNTPEYREPIVHEYSAEMGGDSFINEKKEAFYKISGESVSDESTEIENEIAYSDSTEMNEKLTDEEESEKRWMTAFGKYVTYPDSLSYNGKTCVVSGAGRRAGWKKIQQKLIASGAVFRGTVSGKTDYLIVDPRKTGKRKTEEAVKQIEAGKNLKILLAEDVIKDLEKKEAIFKAANKISSRNKASNMMELMKAKFESMSKEELSLTARKAGDVLANAFDMHAAETGDMKLMLAGVMISQVCIKLGFCTRRLSQKQQWLLKEICPNAIDARKSMAEFVVEPIEESDYSLIDKVILLFTEKMPDREIIQAMFDLLMSAAYIDGGLKPQVEKKIDPMFGLLFLGMFFDSGLESVPAPPRKRQKVVGLQARVLDRMLTEGTLMSLNDIKKAFPEEAPSVVASAVNKLCEKDLVTYYDSMMLDGMYGVNVEHDEVDIVLSAEKKKTTNAPKKTEDRKREEEKKKREAEERRRREAEETKRVAEEMERKRREEEKYNEWEKERDRIYSLRKSLIQSEIDIPNKKLSADVALIHKEYEEKYVPAKEKKKELETTLAKANEELSGLQKMSTTAEKLFLIFGLVAVTSGIVGFIAAGDLHAAFLLPGVLCFLFGALFLFVSILSIVNRNKRIAEKKRLIQTALDGLAEIPDIPTIEQYAQDNKDRLNPEALLNNGRMSKEKEREIRERINRENPIPPEPPRPASYNTSSYSSRNLSAKQSRDYILKEYIVDALSDGDPMTVSDMLENIPELEGDSNQHVSALCRALVMDGRIEKYSEQRRTYFRIPE